MLEQISTSLRVTVFTLALTGLLYPLAVTGVARVAFPHRAGGSIVLDGSGRPVGSELLAQGFSSPAAEGRGWK
jgi:K+-transporting ATPase ATPase C chain